MDNLFLDYFILKCNEMSVVKMIIYFYKLKDGKLVIKPKASNNKPFWIKLSINRDFKIN